MTSESASRPPAAPRAAARGAATVPRRGCRPRRQRRWRRHHHRRDHGGAARRSPTGAHWIERQHDRLTSGHGYSFAIADIATDRAVGQTDLWTKDAEHGRGSTGYWVGPAFRGQGYATAALMALTEWVIGLDQVHRVELHVEPSNLASRRVAEVCGFTHEGLLRSWLPVGDDRRDVHVYSVVRRSSAT
ncbi:MAG: GNAT family N-acetyltransferase [Phycicoccus sp.]